MKLAEALLLRKDMQTKLANLRERLAKAALVQEGDKPAEDAERLIAESAGIIKDLYELIERLHRTNQSEKLADGRAIAAVMAERDRLRQHLALIRFAAERASSDPNQDRYSAREIKWVAQLDVAKLHKQSDDISAKLRELNAALQEANWNIELRA
ncbi:MAG: DIP1984 family protein [Phycisphaerae bacterium]|nr:DIP1984 family protein [Phycisphaerae bacterium]